MLNKHIFSDFNLMFEHIFGKYTKYFVNYIKQHNKKPTISLTKRSNTSKVLCMINAIMIVNGIIHLKSLDGLLSIIYYCFNFLLSYYFDITFINFVKFYLIQILIIIVKLLLLHLIIDMNIVHSPSIHISPIFLIEVHLQYIYPRYIPPKPSSFIEMIWNIKNIISLTFITSIFTSVLSVIITFILAYRNFIIYISEYIQVYEQ